MRARKKKHGAERIAACAELLIENPAILRENPQSPFAKEQPLYLEIGCGKGNFACGMSASLAYATEEVPTSMLETIRPAVILEMVFLITFSSFATSFSSFPNHNYNYK
ncbi:MAG: hypothetical protein PUG74_05030 [Prevotellaceae bacterium]|nr:hypothetical protein [Prevotellaceae bacterium]